jgi:FtsP/CotA-like multicopper oxidase with cupredoxin domain
MSKRTSMQSKSLFICTSGISTATVILAVVTGVPAMSVAQPPAQTTPLCAHLAPGEIVRNPRDIGNRKAIDFIIHADADRKCYLSPDKNKQGRFEEAPTIRFKPNRNMSTITLNLKNDLPGEPPAMSPRTAMTPKAKDPCVDTDAMGMPPKDASNLHFHGFNVSPQCHQDEVIKTVIQPGQNFTYQLQVPKDEPPGLYWYHPHVHMQSGAQVLKGLTGVLIVGGIGKFNKEAAYLAGNGAERVFVLRDMDLPSTFEQEENPNKPWKDISINSVPILYQGNGQFSAPAVIKMRPKKKQFWRVANTAADTYFDLQVTYDNKPEMLQLVGMDGIPINVDMPSKKISVRHILLSPGTRAEFMVKGPSRKVKNALFKTLKYDTNADIDPERTIAKIDTTAESKAQRLALSRKLNAQKPEAVDLRQVTGDRFSGMQKTIPVKERTIFFSQGVPGTPKESDFYITESGKEEKVFDMGKAINASKNPNAEADINVQEGSTEDWTIENHASEAHVFHIHQIHFLVLKNGDPSDQTSVGMLRDTVNLPAWKGEISTDGKPTIPYPKVKLRMDFRGKGSSIAGVFVYHCHILEHEDGGMMGSIKVMKKVN